MRWLGLLLSAHCAAIANQTDALHAVKAERAAAAAQQAAKVATSVASHAQEMHEHAREALKHAHTALHDAQSNAGLSAEQKKSLGKADAALDEATRRVEAEEAEQSEWVKTALEKSAADEASRTASAKLEKQIKDLEKLLDGARDKHDEQEEAEYDRELRRMRQSLEEQLKSEAKEEGPKESTGKMRDELEGMKRQLDTMKDIKKLRARVSGSEDDVTQDEVDALRKEMDDLEEMLKGLDADGGADSVGDLEAELRRLKNAVVDKIKREDERDEAEKATKAKEAKEAEEEEEEAAEASKKRRMGGSMPYGDLEPFGREDTATELTEDSIRESDKMVDQIEKAEVAEEQRAVFRSLTRLRGAALSSFDGVARSQTGNIEQYAHSHAWRSEHPVRHLASEEADVEKWAFPSNAD